LKRQASNIMKGQALPGVYENIVTCIENCNVEKILDAPSGFGVLADLLKERGYNVTCLDIEYKKYSPVDKQIVVSDLADGVPFKDMSFDAVLCIEGIEHLQTPLRLIQEIHRILKDKGFLILSTPNIVNIRSRVKFFLRGELFWFDEAAIFRFGHISPQFPFLLEHLFSNAGFTVLSVTGNKRTSFLGLLAWILFQPFELVKRNRMNAIKYWNSGALIYLCKKNGTGAVST
jgi:SAM-dependent methyltransferase